MGKKILFLIGSCGSGKDYLSLNVENGNVLKQVTTRKKRSSEIDGVTGHFISKEKFRSLIFNDDMLNYEIIERTGDYYGNYKSELKDNQLNIITGDPERARYTIDNLEKDDCIWVIYLDCDIEIKKDRYRKRDVNFSERELNLRIKDEKYNERINKLGLTPYTTNYTNDNFSTPKKFNLFLNELMLKHPNGMD